MLPHIAKRMMMQMGMGTKYIAYDSFNRADGALGNTESIDPDGMSISAFAWTYTPGDFLIDTNRAEIQVNGNRFCIIDVGLRNGLIGANLNFAPGSIGVVASYIDGANNILSFHDFANVYLAKFVGGAFTVLITEATAFIANAELSLKIDGVNVSVYYNGAQVGATQVIGDAVLMTATKCGLFSNTAICRWDSFAFTKY